MNNTHQIIVYRNPLEAAFWDTFMNSSYTFPVIMASVALLVGVWFSTEYLMRLVPGDLRWKYEGKISLTFGALCAVGTFLALVLLS